MFIAALFIIAKNWKEFKCLSTGECINKMWYIITMEYYSSVKRNEVLIHATTWRSLEICERKPGTKDHMLYDSIYWKCPE